MPLTIRIQIPSTVTLALSVKEVGKYYDTPCQICVILKTKIMMQGCVNSVINTIPVL